MLCDQIIAWPIENRENLVPDLFHAYTIFGDKLKQAQRFVLNRDAVMTTHSVTESSPRRFLQALRVCRLPFPAIWVEFAYQDRADWMEQGRKRGMIIEANQEASPPSRLGFYMEQADDEGRVINVVPAWSHPNHGTVSICHLALTIHTEPGDFRLTDQQIAYMREQLRVKRADKVYHKWLQNEDEIQAGFELEARIDQIVPQVFQPIWSHLMLTASLERVRHLHELAQFDLKAEWRFTLALLTVLNSRNVVEIGGESDVSKLNKARLKKGATPLMTHREIRLNMSKVQKRRLGDAGHVDLQAHLVRGHWKLRSSGLYWWNPFVRGSIGEAPQTTTIVRG